MPDPARAQVDIEAPVNRLATALRCLEGLLADPKNAGLTIDRHDLSGLVDVLATEAERIEYAVSGDPAPDREGVGPDTPEGFRRDRLDAEMWLYRSAGALRALSYLLCSPAGMDRDVDRDKLACLVGIVEADASRTRACVQNTMSRARWGEAA
ncbi:MAG TPA: hypothetical protein VH331_14395 [Allosphingosinicella sp.]|jgi:hypothetical protein|nr:hypothetical protein [Allosphingosinicella sp.]